MDQFQDACLHLASTEIFVLAETAPPDGSVPVGFEGVMLDGGFILSAHLLPLGDAGPDGTTRVSQTASVDLVFRDHVRG